MMASRPASRADGSAAPAGYDYREPPRRSIGRWLIALAVLSILTVVVTLAINLSGGGKPREVQVPDVRGKVSADAIAALQNKGFKIRTQQKPDNTVPPDHVISTEPAGTASIFPDHFVGRLSACGALATLIGRERGTLEGGLIELAQCEAVVGSIADLLAAESIEPGSVLPMGVHSERGTPGANFRCAPDAESGTGAEEWVAITCRNDAEWRALAELMGQSELGSDPRFATLESRRANVAELDALIGAWTIEQNRFNVADQCQAAGIPAGPMVTSLDMMNHPHFVERGFPVHIEQPGVLGPVIFEGPAFHASGMTDPFEGPAPALGEHTIAIATEVLGMSTAEVDELIAKGVLEITPPQG
jgi:crotonobetainyl-CoA:carnitine CoA-transferase CaiB-like acyl-CoA transferase